MADNVEQIEARLCAYIDGLLSEAERAEIDAHLAANPSHQVMIRELCGQRQWLVSLPREKAPADLAEPLQNQLERESLLRQDMVIEFSQSHFGRRQLLSAAAILLLSAGLGVMVYSFLPRVLPTTLSHMSGAPQKPPASAVRSDMAAVRNDSPAPVPPAPNVAPAAANAPTAGTTFVFRGAESSVNGAVVLQEDPFFGNQQDAQTVLVAIRTEDLKVASDQLKHYLSSNNIAWTPGDVQMRATIGETPGGAMVAEVRPEAQALARRAVARGMADSVALEGAREEPAAQRIILARNLTAPQLSSLTSAISALPEVQEQQLKDVAVGRQPAVQPRTSDLLRNLQYLMPRSDPALHDLLAVPTTQADSRGMYFKAVPEKQRPSAYNLVILIENAQPRAARRSGADAAVGAPATQPR